MVVTIIIVINAYRIPVDVPEAMQKFVLLLLLVTNGLQLLVHMVV